MRVGKLAAVVGVTACALGVGSVALAASTPQGGKIRVFVTNTSATKGKILITGAIGDYGTTISEDANGKTDPNGNFEKVTLKQGGFLVNATGLNNKLNHAKPTINRANCSMCSRVPALPRSAMGPAPTRHHRQRRDHHHVRGNRAEDRQGMQLRPERQDRWRLSIDHRQWERELQVARHSGSGAAAVRASPRRAASAADSGQPLTARRSNLKVVPTDGVFSARTWEWFRSAFEAPTAAQEQAWPAIASGEHVLISAPTGSGKTLAAFLYAIDQLAAMPRPESPRDRRIGLVYVSPLKALSYDIDRNLRTPLRGIGAPLEVAVRTGDTPQRSVSRCCERARHPDHDARVAVPDADRPRPGAVRRRALVHR